MLEGRRKCRGQHRAIYTLPSHTVTWRGRGGLFHHTRRAFGAKFEPSDARRDFQRI